MTLQNHGTYKDKLQIYVKPENKEVVAKTKIMLKREGSTLSKFITEKILEYYRTHEPGNPQQRLDTIAKIGHAFRADSCQFCGLKPVHYGLKNGVWLGFCSGHWDPKRFRATK
jgi:hypothetical protein